MSTRKTALVTGSTSGIGQAIATRFAQGGADVILSGFGDAEEIEKSRSELEKATGVKVGFSGADLTKPDAISEMMAYAAKDFGGVDILVNNAGIQHVSPIEDFPVNKWDLIIALNLTAAFHTIRLAGAASSTRPLPTHLSPHLTNLPMLPPSMALQVSPKQSLLKGPNTACAVMRSALAMSTPRSLKAKSQIQPSHAA